MTFKFVRLFRWGLGEFLLIIGLVLLINHCLLREKITIKADGQGYYDYLPALFIYGDFPYKSNDSTQEFSDRINQMNFYLDLNGSKINKYPAGVAVLVFPFFNFAHLTALLQGFENDGFSLPYQQAVYYAALFYLLLGLIFLRKLLVFYNISYLVIFLTQLFGVFSTSIINYVNFDPSFSHVYSFFAVTTFLYFLKAWFQTSTIRHLLWAAVFLGLIILIRQVNVIILLFVPFLAGSKEKLTEGVKNVFKNKKAFVAAFALLALIISIQLVLWHVQTGKTFIYSYKGEGFNFLSPAFFSILFSYQKGLFIYTLITFISLFGLSVFVLNKQFYQFYTWVLFFVLLTYVVSSWHSWVYGCSYGSRVYIDFYAVFLILLAILFEKLKSWYRFTLILIALITIPVNIIQTYQYKTFILDWITMNKTKYWTVFLRTEDKYRGLTSKKQYSFNDQTASIIHSDSIQDIVVDTGMMQDLYTESSARVKQFESINIIQVSFDHSFPSQQTARMELNIRDSLTNETYYYHQHPVIHYVEKGLGRWQTGLFNYDFAPIGSQNYCKIKLLVFTKQEPLEIKNLKIKYIAYRP